MWLVQLPECNESHKMEKKHLNKAEARHPQTPPRCHETAANPAEAPRFYAPNPLMEIMHPCSPYCISCWLPPPQKKASARRHRQEAAKRTL
ncbi:hypothetical protein SASPL_131194 [Salvia splendens]|uniref:Uncharacterized protein n=1 Tax=Salvia splendens TaxID=180675 RepID=A0A8X8X7C5_SALSN|nr:hypothetical protein SASPL_131194 [Salvia splendens]